MKYRPSFRLLKLITPLVLAQWVDCRPKTDYDLVVPIPARPESALSRGFDICRYLAFELLRQDPSLSRARAAQLSWRKIPRSQASVPHNQRLSNIKNSFSANPKVFFEKRVLLIDDVITTGATAQAAVVALKQSGVESVDVVSLARSVRWTEFRQALHREIQKCGQHAES